MSNDSAQNITPDNQGQGQAQPAVAPTIQTLQVPVQPAPNPASTGSPASPQGTLTAPLVEPEPVNPLLESVQTKKAIEFFRANPDVLKHVNEQVTETLPDFNPAPNQFVPMRAYLTDQAVARHNLNEADAKLLAGVPEDSIGALAARLAAKPAETSTVNPQPADPTQPTAGPQLPKPVDTGKVSPTDRINNDLATQALAAIKANFGG